MELVCESRFSDEMHFVIINVKDTTIRNVAVDPSCIVVPDPFRAIELDRSKLSSMRLKDRNQALTFKMLDTSRLNISLIYKSLRCEMIEIH